MAEEAKNLSMMSGQYQSSSSNKLSSAGYKDQRGKQSSKKQSSQNITESGNELNIGINGGQNWVPQWGDQNKSYKQKDKQTQQSGLNKQNSVFNNKKPEKYKSNIDFDYDEDITNVGAYKNQSANHLLAFTFKEEEAAQNYQRRQGNFYSSKGRGRNGYNTSSYFSKEQYVQSQLKFIVKRERDYLINLYDPNEIVEWKDVVSVIYNMMNADDVQCPICLENLKQMIAPKITKCGHIYCWPCILQYLAFEKDRNWKRCPLCYDPIYKHELKGVQIIQSNYYKPGQTITFNLMVRSKASIIVKDKGITGQAKGDMPTQTFPNQSEQQYHNCRLLLSEKDLEFQQLQQYQTILMADQKLMQSSQEFEKVPYIKEAIDHCDRELGKLKVSRKSSDYQEDEDIIDFEEKKRRHNFKQSLKNKTESESIEESSQHCFYFYQSSTGENLYLHPICQKILQSQYYNYENYPSSFQAQILEVNYGVVDMYDHEFKKHPYLNHLPNGSAYGFVEVDMSQIVSPAVYRDFSQQLSQRVRQRQRKLQKEEHYSGKVDNINNEKFEHLKREAKVAVNTHPWQLKPGVVKNIMYEGNNQEEEVKEESNKENQNNETINEVQTHEQKLWNDFGNIIEGNTINVARKDILEGVEMSLAMKKKLLAKNAKKADDEFSGGSDVFSCAASIVIMEGPKKNKKKRRH